MTRLEETQTDDDSLPPPSALGVVLSALLADLEETDPGLCQRLTRRIERDRIKSAVIALRGPRITAPLEKAIAQGSRWMRMTQLFAESIHGPPETRGKAKRRR